MNEYVLTLKKLLLHIHRTRSNIFFFSLGVSFGICIESWIIWRRRQERFNNEVIKQLMALQSDIGEIRHNIDAIGGGRGASSLRRSHLSLARNIPSGGAGSSLYGSRHREITEATDYVDQSEFTSDEEFLDAVNT